MPRYLLLGAGFSRNWGGWLAGEVANDLLWRLRHKPDLCEILMRSGFEDAYHEIRSSFVRQVTPVEDVILLETAIRQTFAEMNIAFAKLDNLRFQGANNFYIIHFLAQFDAIFTLNQDLLLELHYINSELPQRGRWQGIQYPGISQPQILEGQGTSGARRAFINERCYITHPKPELYEKNQPIYKLHGSVNWYDGEGNDRAPTLVIGRDKSTTIEVNPLLSSYSRIFRESLSQKDALLMTVGYGFSDGHINDAILAANNGGTNFGLFVVDPLGRDVLGNGKQEGAKDPYPLNSVRYVGGSTRTFASTFAGDELEFAKLNRFFQD